MTQTPLSQQPKGKHNRSSSLIPVIKGALIASILFSAIMGILLLATFVQTRIHDPINSPALRHLLKQSQKDPANTSLKDEIRAFDLLARKAYFTSIWQLRIGGFLLILSVFVTVLLLKALFTLSPGIVSPPRRDILSWWAEQSMSRKIITSTGAILLITTFVSTFLLNSELGGTGESASSRPAASSKEMLEQWPGFRGPGGLGIASFTNAPFSWDGNTMAGVTWKVKVPRQGNSSPVVWKKRLFLTGGDETMREVFCFSLDNGKLLWRYQVALATAAREANPKIDKETGYAASTPACDGKRIFALFPTGELVALSLEGKLIWSKYLGVPENHYGHSSSLVTEKGILFVQYDHDKGKLLALNSSTGELVWEAKRNSLSWASPIYVNTGKRHELVLVDNETVTSYNPENGTILWSQNCMYGEVAPSPAYSDGRIFVTTEYSPAAAIRVPDTTDGDSLKVLWRWNGELPSTSSPVASKNYVFFASADGTLSCVDAEKGTDVWTQEFDEGFYSSPILVGDKVYLIDRKGVMNIFKVDNKYEEVARSSLGESCVTTPAILNDCVVIRGVKHLFCIDGKKKG